MRQSPARGPLVFPRFSRKLFSIKLPVSSLEGCSNTLLGCSGSSWAMTPASGAGVIIHRKGRRLQAGCPGFPIRPFRRPFLHRNLPEILKRNRISIVRIYEGQRVRPKTLREFPHEHRKPGPIPSQGRRQGGAGRERPSGYRPPKDGKGIGPSGVRAPPSRLLPLLLLIFL